MSHVCARPEPHPSHYHGYGRLCSGREPSRFSRSRDGKTVHRTDCQVRGDRLPWQWADDKTDRTILETPGLRPCKRCMGELADAL